MILIRKTKFKIKRNKIEFVENMSDLLPIDSNCILKYQNGKMIFEKKA